MKTLVSMDTKAVNGPAYIKKQTGEEVTDFQNGDQTSTLIRTENGKTMLIQHNVMTPRPYSRMYQIVRPDRLSADGFDRLRNDRPAFQQALAKSVSRLVPRTGYRLRREELRLKNQLDS